MTSDLLPCPFCDSKNIGVERSECGRCGYAVCDDCGAEGPVVNAFRDGPDAQVILIPFQDEAISLWNTRSHSPSVERMPEEPTKEMVLALCKAFKEEPMGTQNWVENGALRQETFYERNHHALTFMIAALKLIGGAG